jgi:hypothetical protein
MKLRTPDGEWEVDVIKITRPTAQGTVSSQTIRVRHLGFYDATLTSLAEVTAQPWFRDLEEV